MTQQQLLQQVKQFALSINLCISQNKLDDPRIQNKNNSLSSLDIARAIKEYGRTVVDIPASGSKLIDVIAIRGHEKSQWSVVMPLWTQEEGRSDLSVEMTVEKSSSGFTATIDNIHVR